MSAGLNPQALLLRDVIAFFEYQRGDDGQRE